MRVESEFISIGCNKVPGCFAMVKAEASISSLWKGLCAYGGNQSIALGWPNRKEEIISESFPENLSKNFSELCFY